MLEVVRRIHYTCRVFAYSCRWLIFVAFLLPSSAVYAAPPASKEDLDGLMARGVERYKRQDYENARQYFARAYELSPRTAILFNLALAEVQSGEMVAAVRHFRLYAKSIDAADEKLEATRTKWLPRAEGAVGLLRIEAPAGVSIYVDGELVSAAPLDGTWPVRQGPHTVEIVRGTDRRSKSVVATFGAVTQVAFEAPQVTVPSGVTKVVAPPPTSVRAGAGPSTGKIVTVATLTGAAVFTGTVTVALALAASHEADTVATEQARGNADGAASKRAQASHDKRSSLALGFGAATVALVAADILAYVLWPRSSEASSRPVVTPIGRDGATLGWSGRF